MQHGGHDRRRADTRRLVSVVGSCLRVGAFSGLLALSLNVLGTAAFAQVWGSSDTVVGGAGSLPFPSGSVDGGNGTLTDAAAAQQVCSQLQAEGAQALGHAGEKASASSLLGELQETKLGASLVGRGQGLLTGSLSSACAALAGGGGGLGGFDVAGLKDLAGTAALEQGFGLLRGSGLPFTGRLEVSGAMLGGGGSNWEVLTVQPLWQDTAGQNHVFSQLSWNRTTDRPGYANGDVVNAGLAWRRLSEDETLLYGANAFLDHALDAGHNRMSVGADMQTSQLGIAANHYFPLSGWKSIDGYMEERASTGTDLELQGRVPSLPSWQATLRGYQWSGNADYEQESTLGYEAGLEWTPIHALSISGGLRDEQHNAAELYGQVRLAYRFGEGLGELLRQPETLRSVRDRVYDKVRRENAMRVERRTKASAYVTVVQSVGTNMAALVAGTVGVTVGADLPRPFTITVDGAPGSLVRLSFRDGALLTIGAGSTVRVEADRLTLLAGLFQYVSGTVDLTINVPGGVVTLLGTDVDVSTNGATSTLRVREGSARLDGSSAGSAVLAVGQVAASVNGVVGSVLAANDTVSLAHTSAVSEAIDRAASQQTGVKVAPYPYKAPELLATGDTVGDEVKIGVAFSIPIHVTGAPQLMLAVAGHERPAAYSAGDSTETQLVFRYTLQAGDVGITSLTAKNIDLNGGAIMGDGKHAVTTMADTVLALGGSVGAGQDNTPDPLGLTDVAGATLNTVTPSNSVTVGGIGPNPVAVSVAGDGTPQISINGGGWVTSGTISAGQSLQVRLTSANAVSTAHTATVTLGTVDTAWTVTTLGQDDTPDPLALTDVTGATLSTVASSNSVTVGGIGPNPVAVSVAGDGTPQININSGGWVTSGMISAGQSLQVRLTSANVVSTAHTATVTLGTVDTVWTVTTLSQDDTPDPLALTDVIGAALNAVTPSNSVTVSGIGPNPVAVSVAGDGSPQININSGGWVTSGTISVGQSLQVRLTSANAANTAHTATVTLGTVDTAWTVTTDADPCTAPSPSLGQLCADGSWYAGQYMGQKLFVQAADESAGITWNNGTSNWVDLTLANCSGSGAGCGDGKTATASLVGYSNAGAPYNAAKACDDSTAHGQTDWFLPSLEELIVLQTLYDALDAARQSTFDSTFYWSSSEYDSTFAWFRRFSFAPTSSQNPKGNSFPIRCVRR